MVDLLAAYCTVLRRSIEVCDALAALYQPDVAIDWAERSLMQTASMRLAFADRLANPELTVGQTSAVTGIIDRYLDGHWADYDKFIKPDPAKHQQLLRLHATLKSLMDEIAPIHNALRTATQGR